MTTLARWVMETAFGTREKEQIEISLFRGDTEVGIPRIPVEDWQITSRGTATTTVEFGPYDLPVAYDRYVLFAGGQQLAVIPEASRAQFPAGFRWSFNPEIVISYG